MSLEVNVATVSYAAGGLAFLLLTLLLLTRWRRRLRGAVLVAACALTAAWALSTAAYVGMGAFSIVASRVLEVLRDVAWFAFLLSLLPEASAEFAERRRRFLRAARLLVFALSSAILVAVALFHDALTSTQLLLCLVALPVIGLVLVEQLVRNCPLEKRWNIKYLCIGLGALFAYDFFMYSDALLFRRIEGDLWVARGAVVALIAPLVAVSAARNPTWALEVHVSRRVIFHSATLIAAGIYLLLLSAAGYYVRLFGGGWGGVLQTAFIFGAVLLFVMLIFSERLRARLRVYVSRHFFSYRFDYRDEWVRFNRTLAGMDSQEKPLERVIRSIAQIVESPKGVLWSRRGPEYFPVAALNLPVPDSAVVSASEPLPSLLRETGWVVNLDELGQLPAGREPLAMPEWHCLLPDAWLVVPLSMESQLPGFVAVTAPAAPVALNWESYDLLKVAGAQAANYLAQLESAEVLAETRQFQAFSQMSAFVVHDLKNLIAQLSLLVTNADRHKANPAFVEDMLATVRNSVGRMQRLLDQLRAGGAEARLSTIDLRELVEAVVSGRAQNEPAPRITECAPGLMVKADRDRMASVIGHLIQNAQEATRCDGKVTVSLRAMNGQAVLEVEDDGCGMDAQFVRERLFKPFETTKGLTGMGIGAFETREFVRALGGDLRVSSEPGAGTRFRVSLPVIAAAEAAGGSR